MIDELQDAGADTLETDLGELLSPRISDARFRLNIEGDAASADRRASGSKEGCGHSLESLDPLLVPVVAAHLTQHVGNGIAELRTEVGIRSGLDVGGGPARFAGKRAPSKGENRLAHSSQTREHERLDRSPHLQPLPSASAQVCRAEVLA